MTKKDPKDVDVSKPIDFSKIDYDILINCLLVNRHKKILYSIL